MSDSVNYGISGAQNITAENLAVGPGSKIEQSNGSQALERELRLLQKAIDQADLPPDAQRQLAEGHDELAHELQAAVPNKQRILSKLAWMRDVAGPAATVVQATTALAQLAGSLL